MELYDWLPVAFAVITKTAGGCEIIMGKAALLWVMGVPTGAIVVLWMMGMLN